MRKKLNNSIYRALFSDITPEEKVALDGLLRKSGENDYRVAMAAQRDLAVAATGPIRQGILEGDIVGGIFSPLKFETGQPVEFPLDFLVPGTEGDYTAFTIPNHGYIPEKHIEGDLVTIQTYDVGAAIDWLLKFARDARWDIVARGLAVLEAMFLRKKNIDAWHTIIAAVVNRNIMVYDSAADPGFLTKRLISLTRTVMQRSGGGNLASLNPIDLTDVWLSPEGVEDIRSWDLTMIDDVTRREIFLAEGYGGLARIFGVDLHPMIELGQGQVFQQYFESLGGELAAGDIELAIGLCLNNPDVFVNPVRAEIEIFEDEHLHRQRRQGYYGWGEHGFGILDQRFVVGLSY